MTTQAWSMLTARALGHHAEPRGFGSLRPEDVLSMLSGLEPDPMNAGMAYHFFDRQSLEHLKVALWQETLEAVRIEAEIADDKAVRAQRASLARQLSPMPLVCCRIAELALFEFMQIVICLECNGHGTTTFNLDEHPGLVLSPYFEALSEREGRIRCAACQGSGRVRLSDRKRADLAGISKDSWHRMWARRYEVTHTIVVGWLDQAHGHLNRRMSENSQAA